MKVLTILIAFHYLLVCWQTPIAIIDNGVISITSAHQRAASWDLSKKEQCMAHSGLLAWLSMFLFTGWQASEFILSCICLKGTVKNVFIMKVGVWAAKTFTKAEKTVWVVTEFMGLYWVFRILAKFLIQFPCYRWQWRSYIQNVHLKQI